MKLDRNINPDGIGKYGLLSLRNVKWHLARQTEALDTLGNDGLLDYGQSGESEFFVIKLRDKYAFRALVAYAAVAEQDGEKEWANEIRKLAFKALNHPNKHKPD